MREFITTIFKTVYAEKLLFTALCVFAGLSILVILHMVFVVQPSELRVVTQYTAYGVTHFYRDSWVYFLNYIALIMLTLILHGSVAVKMQLQERKNLALGVLWVGIFIILFTWLTFMRLVEFS